jgi:hypothetical protein
VPLHGRSYFSAAIVAAAAGCGGAEKATSPALPAPVTQNTAVTTDSSAYTLSTYQLGYETVILMTYVNSQAGPIQFSSCPDSVPSRLERWNGQAWETGWQWFGALACGDAPPYVVPPGGRYQLFFALSGLFPTSRFLGARFSRDDPTGIYRAVWDVKRVPGSTDSSIPIPLEATLSNNFEIRLHP